MLHTKHDGCSLLTCTVIKFYSPVGIQLALIRQECSLSVTITWKINNLLNKINVCTVVVLPVSV